MHPEEAKKIKCDRCGATCSLLRHATGWRCTQCIWNERENLIAWAKNLLKEDDYTNALYSDKRAVVVSRKNMDSLAEVVEEVTS